MGTAVATLACAMSGREQRQRRFNFSLRSMAPESIFGRRTPRDPEQIRQQLQERKEKLAASIATLRESRTGEMRDVLGNIPLHIISAMFILPSIGLTIAVPGNIWPAIPASLVGYLSLGLVIAGYSAAVAIRKLQLRQVEKQESALPSAPAKSE